MAKEAIVVLDKKTRKKLISWRANGGHAAPIRNSKERDDLRIYGFR